MKSIKKRAGRRKSIHRMPRRTRRITAARGKKRTRRRIRRAPLQPLPSYNQAYDAGFDSAYNEGFNVGYPEGLEVGRQEANKGD